MRYDYKKCRFCGCSLDIGETCDCQEENTAPKMPDKATKKEKAINVLLFTENSKLRQIKAI